MVAMPVCAWRLRQDDLLSAEVRSGQHGEVPGAPLKHPHPQIPHIIVRPGRSLTVGPGAICLQMGKWVLHSSVSHVPARRLWSEGRIRQKHSPRLGSLHSGGGDPKQGDSYI